MMKIARKPLILIIEDDKNMAEIFEALMSPFAEIISAQTKNDARIILEEHLDEAFLVAIDACVPGHEANTQDLLKEVLGRNFKGYIVSISGDPNYRKEYLELGCTNACEKQNLPSLAKELLNLPRAVV